MELRRIQRTPDGTYFVVLPKELATRIGLERGTVVSFQETQNGQLLMQPYTKTEKKPAETMLHPSPNLQREIIEAYLLGFDIIRIESGEVIGSEMREKAKHTLKRLVGLEIVEEDSRKIEIQCIVEPSLLSPEKILRRVHLITLPMEKDAVRAFTNGDERLAANVIERDEEVDRLYFLLVRLVRAAIIDHSLLEKIQAKPVDCLDYRILASYMEGFGDYAVDISENVGALKDNHLSAKQSQIVDRIGDEVYELYKDAVGAVLSRNLNLASNTVKRHALLEKLIPEAQSISASSKALAGGVTSTLEALNRMSDLSIDIADLTARG